MKETVCVLEADGTIRKEEREASEAMTLLLEQFNRDNSLREERDNKLNAILDLIRFETVPSDKTGFDWKRTYIGDFCIMKQYVKRKEGEDGGDGSPSNPFNYAVGMAVERAKRYTDGEKIKECIKSGIPVNFLDSEYFDAAGI